MGITKTEGFPVKTNELAEMLKALGHPARLSIMHYLSQQESCICNDIVDKLPLAQPTISRHLSELKKVGLIVGEISGNNISYCINPVGLSKVKKTLIDLAKACHPLGNCC